MLRDPQIVMDTQDDSNGRGGHAPDRSGRAGGRVVADSLMVQTDSTADFNNFQEGAIVNSGDLGCSGEVL